MNSTPWSESDPSHYFLLHLLFTLAAISLIATITFKNTTDRAALVAGCGVKVRKISRALREIERKSFHMSGILVPITHQALLLYGVPNRDCVRLCWTITILGWLADLSRLYIPIVRRNWPLSSILRSHEMNQLTGGCFFSLGCTVTISISPPSVAMASILFLVGRPS